MHKRIGILGGMSPESTVAYYEYITRTYTERYGDYGYPEILIYSVSFQPYVDWPNQDRWDLVAQGLSEAAQKLVAAGADFLIIATNTMHLVFDEVQARVEVPMLSLLDATGRGHPGPGPPHRGPAGYQLHHGKGFLPGGPGPPGASSVLVPDAADREYVNGVIYDELVAGQIRDESRAGLRTTSSHELAERGAEGIILGCTEIPLLVDEADAGLPLFDTTPSTPRRR